MSDTERIDVMGGLKTVLTKIEEACLRRSKDLPQITPRLVCVSKTQTNPVIVDAYDAGQRHFGENYANELYDKATSADILERCKDIQWHYIGLLQSNKVNKVLGCQGLFMVETINSQKLADTVNKQWPKYSKDGKKLNVMVQINTSGESAKNGIEPGDAPEIARHILDNCSNLALKGLMTIGEYGYDCSKGPNPDFVTLAKCREAVCLDLGKNISDLELSMGMSSDYEHAIELGATNVRVGSLIFGARPSKH